MYVISVLLAYRHKNGELMPYVGVILASVQLFQRIGPLLVVRLNVHSLIVIPSPID